MSKLRIVIADDERPAREFLKSILREFEQVELVGEAENGTDAVDLIKRIKPDLALLDLKMPEMSGIEAVRQLRKSQMPLVAFVTAHDEFAVQAFEVNAVDYLLKPVERSRLAETISRSIERLETEDWRSVETDKLRQVADAYSEAASHEPLDRIPVRLRDEIILVPVTEISSIVADGELLHITTTSKKKYSINHRLKDLELRLDPRIFVRLSRGTLVNLSLIATVHPMPGGTYEIVLDGGESHATSRQQSRLLRSRLFKL